MAITLKEARSLFIAELVALGIDRSEARAEADLAMGALTGLGAAALIVQGDKPLELAQASRFEEILAQRRTRRPIQYILGQASFMGLDFSVDDSVLIPRHDTEILVDAARLHLEKIEHAMSDSDPGSLHLLEVGAGSGIIAVSLLKRMPGLKATAFEISPGAARVCRANAARHGVEGRLHLIEGDYRQGLAALGGAYNIFVSNPPYIPSADLPGLAPEVRGYEPELALRGEGEDGLGFYRSFAQLLPSCQALKKAAVFLEFGQGQGPQVQSLFRDAGYEATLIADLSGKPRVMAGLPN